MKNVIVFARVSRKWWV